MVITLRLDDEYTRVFNELKCKLTDDTKDISITPTNSQIIKALILHGAEDLNINIDHMIL